MATKQLKQPKLHRTKQLKQPKLHRTQLAQLRVKDLRRLLPGGELDHGSHSDAPDGVCLMEAVAWIAGEPHSDHPKCACPILTDIGIDINDTTDDEGRQRLIPAIPALIGSKTGSKRAYFKRSRRAAELVLEALIEGDEPARKAKGAENTLERYAYQQLAALKGRNLTKASLKAAIDSLEYLQESGAEFHYGENEDVRNMLTHLYEAWDSTGIGFADYSSILGSVSFTSVIPEERLPDFFVEVATQNA